jgi:hypothetical protein
MPPFVKEQQQVLARLVHLRMGANGTDQAAALDSEIDEIFYASFELTDAEKELICNSTF